MTDIATGLPVGGPAKPNVQMTKMIYAAAAVFCLTPLASPPIALALGTVLALSVVNPFEQATRQIAKILLQACVVLLGFGMNLPVVLRAGLNGLTFASITISCTLVIGMLIGRWLGIRTRTSTLISCGTAICGGSAIAAVGAVIGSAEGDMSVALGTVFILNAVALYVFPPVGHWLHMTQGQFGVWAGVAIHDVSSVVGASSRYGLEALQTATAVKLSRGLWIIPVSLGAAMAFGPSEKGKVTIPWFIGLFLLASVTRSFVPGVAAIAPTLSVIAKIGLTCTLFLIGAGLSMKTLRAVGWRPLVQGTILWLMVSIGSLVVILKGIV